MYQQYLTPSLQCILHACTTRMNTSCWALLVLCIDGRQFHHIVSHFSQIIRTLRGKLDQAIKIIKNCYHAFYVKHNMGKTLMIIIIISFIPTHDYVSNDI